MRSWPRWRPGERQTLVSCFHRPTIDRVRERGPTSPPPSCTSTPTGPPRLADAVAHGHGALHPWVGWVTEDLVAAAHAEGVTVNTWTVDDPADMVRLAALGVDGIVTNVPDVALAALGARSGA